MDIRRPSIVANVGNGGGNGGPIGYFRQDREGQDEDEQNEGDGAPGHEGGGNGTRDGGGFADAVPAGQPYVPGDGHAGEQAVEVDGILGTAGMAPEVQRAFDALAETVEPLRHQVETLSQDLQDARAKDGRHAFLPLPSRAGFFDVLEGLIRRTAGIESKPSLIVISLANASDIRFSEGRQALDRVLMSIADTLSCPSHNALAVGNIGGEDFALVILEAGYREARAKASGLVRTLAETLAAYGVTVDLRYGVAIMTAAMTPDEAVQAADRDLVGQGTSSLAV